MLTSGLVYFVNEDRHPRAIKLVDPLIALFSISCLMVASYPLMKRFAIVLLQGVPKDLNIKTLTGEIMQQFPNDILNVHEFHMWSLMHGQIVANLHVCYQNFEVRIYEQWRAEKKKRWWKNKGKQASI